MERSKNIRYGKFLTSLVAKIVYLLFACEIHDTSHLHAALFCVCFVYNNSQAVSIFLKYVFHLNCLFITKRLISAIWCVLRSVLLHYIRGSGGWKARLILTSQRQADFHLDIPFTRLGNRTPDKLKGLCFFSWHSILHPFKMKVLTSK